MKLIEITEKKYEVNIELSYAKNNNFTGKKIYKKINVLSIKTLYLN